MITHILRCTVLLCIVLTARFALGQLPVPVTEEETTLFSRWLGLDQDQQDILAALYGDYDAEIEAELLGVGRALGSRQDEIIAQMIDPATDGGAAAKREYPAFEQELRDLQERMDAQDESFFTAIESILSPQQMPRMVRVRLGRVRLFHDRTRRDLPEGNVDVITLIDGLPLTPETYRLIEQAFTLEFEPRFGEAVLRTRRAARQQSIRLFDHMSMKFRLRTDADLTSLEQTHLIERMQETVAKAGRARGTASRTLVQMNREARTRLLELLPEDAAAEFDRLYWKTAYPRLFPDPSHAAMFYDAAESLDDLTDDQRDSIEVFRMEFQRRHARLTDRMTLATYDRHWHAYSGSDSPRGDFNENWIQLFTSGAEREELNRSQRGRLALVLTPEQLAHVPKWDEDKRRSRPWDRSWEADRENESRRGIPWQRDGD